MTRGRIIILEGPDGVGKTTLADAIEAQVDGPVVRFRQGPPPDDSMAALHYMDGIDSIMEARQNDTTVIVDRFHVGELVYGPLLRGGSGITVDEATVIDMRLEGIGAALVHCTLDPAEMVRRLYARDGGKPDEKSGATVGHSHSIRASFLHKLGRPERRGVLPSNWQYVEMTGYPEQMARKVLTCAKFSLIRSFENGVYGSQYGGTDAILLPEDGGEDMAHLAWLVGMLRDMGRLDRTCLLTRDAIKAGLEPHGGTGTVIVLGDAIDWVQQEAVPYDFHISHSVDLPDYDDTTFREALAACLGLDTTRRTGGGLNESTEVN